MSAITPRDKPEEWSTPELEKWLVRYGQEVFSSPQVNFGGTMRRTLALRHCLKIAFKLAHGDMETLTFFIQRDLGLTKRRIKENYIATLKDFGMIKQNSGKWRYTGKRPKTQTKKKKKEDTE